MTRKIQKSEKTESREALFGKRNPCGTADLCPKHPLSASREQPWQSSVLYAEREPQLSRSSAASMRLVSDNYPARERELCGSRPSAVSQKFLPESGKNSLRIPYFLHLSRTSFFALIPYGSNAYAEKHRKSRRFSARRVSSRQKTRFSVLKNTECQEWWQLQR